MKNQKHITLGLVLVILSSIVYGLEIYFNTDTEGEPFGALFFLHYTPALLYMFFVKYEDKHFWRFFQKENFAPHTLLLVLFNISAYSLNRNLPVFNESTDWLTVFLVIENGLLISYALVNKPSKYFEYTLCFFLVIALFFNVYQTLMILPISFIGIIASPFFGISLLLFIPMFYIASITTLLSTLKWHHGHQIAAGTAVVLSVGIMASFCTQWQAIENTVLKSKLVQDAPFSDDQGLPDWVSIAQSIDDGPFTEKYLKTGLVYQRFANYRNSGFSSIWRSSLDQKFVHDPLVSIASIFMKKSTLDEMTKIKVLNYLYDARHQTTDRFWSGENLKSKQIVTNVELFPEERLSFTEQIITISNDRMSRGRWRSQQEALFTFDMPEGGVVTSLSLWIEGQEAKAILTSKSKAQKAYNTIVGRERRDPSVAFWMEGNKVRVRVFPCTPEEDRKFKIGITAPLVLTGQQLNYQSVGFKGPDYSKADGAIHVVTHGADLVQSTLDFDESPMYRTWQGSYVRDWSLSIDDTRLPKGSFSFHDEHFAVEKTTLLQRDLTPTVVYMDVSNAWTTQELEEVSVLLQEQEIYTFTTHMKKITSPKSIARIADTNLPTFTLFPFHQVQADQAIIITKGGKATPNLADLKNTPFKDDLFKHIKEQSSAPLVLDIGNEPSDYMKSLKEFGVIDHHLLSMTELIQCFDQHHFPIANHDPNLTVIPQNGLSIRRLDSAKANGKQASDHLMRLFYYQEIMSKIGNQYFTEDGNEYIEEHIVDQAARANIVTPLSSLIVLETQQDYDRFDIQKKKDSLGNANISNAGAVPEPHEWALIIAGIGVLFFWYWSSKKASVQS
ncbi:XrtN system VIT domain-containing protein [Reichenbachiella sp. 5M10]|uniref:XrtN system VIT domain-containing protein n=1 Tax=Reichenbachiella sp. 5M10 TaxID=1889772 RepID=UPI00117AF1A4|nr:XrtN system VIT domain-containing protein [Reichenbachiella sp. 5M10]